MITTQEETEMVRVVKDKMFEHGIYVTELAKEVRRSRVTVHNWFNHMNEQRFSTLTAAIDRIIERETTQ